MSLTDTFSHYYPDGFVGCASYEQAFGSVAAESFCDAVHVRGCTYWRNGFVGAIWHELIRSSDFAYDYQEYLWDSLRSQWYEWLSGLSEDDQELELESGGPDGQSVEADWAQLMDDPSWITPSLVL